MPGIDGVKSDFVAVAVRGAIDIVGRDAGPFRVVLVSPQCRAKVDDSLMLGVDRE